MAAYQASLNASDAYRKAGYRGRDAAAGGYEILRKPHVAAAIAEKMEDRLEKLEISADDLLRRAEQILTADARKITSHHIGACRYCWGIDHHFQWRTPREFSEAVELHMLKGEAYCANHPPPEMEGGYGYRKTAKPHPDCPECDGLGITYTVFADTRDIPEDALVLFEGVKETRNGIEIQMASKQAAFDVLAKAKGLAVNKHELTGKDGKPIQHDVKVKAKVVLVPAKAHAPIEVRSAPKADDT